MKSLLRSIVAVASLAALPVVADTIIDATGEIDPGIADGGGTLDIVSMEVSNNLTDITLTLTVNGNITSTDWGNFMIGIANQNSAGTTTGNGWNRPINLDAGGGNGMTHWVGSWVNAGGGSQLWTYDGVSSWGTPVSPAGFSFSAGAQSTITYTLSLASLGVSVGDTIALDAYSSGGGGSDSAVDALSNPSTTITSWSQTYTSSGSNLSTYTIVPEPSSVALVGMGVLLVGRLIRRRRT